MQPKASPFELLRGRTASWRPSRPDAKALIRQTWRSGAPRTIQPSTHGRPSWGWPPLKRTAAANTGQDTLAVSRLFALAA